MRDTNKEWYRRMKTLTKNALRYYKEHWGILIIKYRSFWGRYVFVLEEQSNRCKVYVGRGIYEMVKEGSKLTVGEINGQLVNIRPGFCKNTGEKSAKDRKE